MSDNDSAQNHNGANNNTTSNTTGKKSNINALLFYNIYSSDWLVCGLIDREVVSPQYTVQTQTVPDPTDRTNHNQDIIIERLSVHSIQYSTDSP